MPCLTKSLQMLHSKFQTAAWTGPASLQLSSAWAPVCSDLFRGLARHGPQLWNIDAPSLIWTVQPGLRRESPSDVSLMVCEPCPELGAQSSARCRGGALEVQAAGVVNQPTRGLPFVSSLFSSQTAKPVTVRHQGSAVCQHLPADKDRGRKSVGPQRPRRARRVSSRYTASTYVSAQWQQPNRKHSCGEYITGPPLPPRWWKVTMDGSELIPPPWAPAKPRLLLQLRALLLRWKGE